jgi:DNA-binding response OmpR family regulator
MADVWDENWFGSTKTLDVHVSSLRRKLMLHGEPAERISTVRGRGYRFEAEPAG